MLDRWRRRYGVRRLKESEFAFLYERSEAADGFVCFDCETTGLDPQKDRIITLSAVKIKGNQVLASQALNLTIEQFQPISAESIVVHHIRNQDVQQASERVVNEREAMRRFLHFIGSAPLVGYYLEFDVAMVNQIIEPWLGIKLPNPKIEVSELYYQRRLQEVKHSITQPNIDLSFDVILERLGIPNFGQHDAYSDAIMTALIFLKLQYPRQDSNTVINHLDNAQ
ncbi:3'-5' exonuclease [Thiomicrorhabdus sp. zzn3]|uniref:3'-5' exonuclease n=1 Tax=Thiomicrorhabdus sp. zzn3 TaxID=3039775 RepID=UPI002436816C|nr:3'-5' exonuclease [Thiomicrorhabdus sp. zzn3]MDG6777885.1 3'-5' exonuclease [Thiomicrorhabdus sp. zzn3]